MTHPKKSLSMMVGEALRNGGALLLAANAVFTNYHTRLLVAVSVLCVITGIVIERNRKTWAASSAAVLHRIPRRCAASAFSARDPPLFHSAAAEGSHSVITRHGRLDPPSRLLIVHEATISPVLGTPVGASPARRR
jgi:hypothetical protein